MHYSTITKITENTGNNSFSYEERKKQLGKAEIIIPSLIEGTIHDLQVGDHIVFEEIDHKGNLRQCKGLKNLVKLKDKKTPIYIFDNHNHALYFRYIEAWGKNLDLLHIDQHSDLALPKTPIDVDKLDEQDYIRHYTNHICNVGNFIPPALDSLLIKTCQQIRSVAKLLQTQIPSTPYILDIDLDFRAPEMSIGKHQQTIEKTQELISKASLITIATSPYFLDQDLAIELLHQLLN